MITRRSALIALALGVVLPSAIAAPPPGKVLRLGLLYAIPVKFDPESRLVDRAIVESLRAQGYEVGRNLVLEFSSGKGDAQRVSGAAAELVRLKVDAIITVGTEAMLAARDATRTIPTIMIGGTDPVGTGAVVSLSRPGGNITGMSINAAEISAKRVQLLKEAVPKLSRVAVLWNSSSRSMTLQFQHIEVASPSLGVIVQSIGVSGSDDLDKAFAAIAESKPGGLVVLFGALRGNDLPRIVEFVTSNRLPTVFELGQGVRGGGLMEFGASSAVLARHVGTYVDKIANGANPGDLPVQEPTEFRLVINLKAARTMGLTIPSSLLLRADRVIE